MCERSFSASLSRHTRFRLLICLVVKRQHAIKSAYFFLVCPCRRFGTVCCGFAINAKITHLLGNLVPERGVDFPFVIECKRYKSGDGMRPDWWGQASRAANRAGKLPCVVYKFNHRDVRVVVPLHAVMCEEENNGFVAVLDLEGFCYLVREMMNE